jgi:LETM1 and EF-hand domain-containing protein 1, mitochondrial
MWISSSSRLSFQYILKGKSSSLFFLRKPIVYELFFLHPVYFSTTSLYTNQQGIVSPIVSINHNNNNNGGNHNDFIPTTLRNGRGRPQRLAPLVPPTSLLQNTTTVSTQPRPFRPTPLPRNLTSPIPPLAEIPTFIFNLLVRAMVATLKGLSFAGRWIYESILVAIRDPARAKQSIKEFWTMIKEEAHHYWVGSKLFVAEVKTSAVLLRRVGRGEMLSRRERMQLKRTMGDLLRMVPFIIITIVPFAELALPVLLKLFPNMLPSQFEKAEYRQEAYRKSLNVKLELNGILQEILQERIEAGAASSAGTGASSFEQLRRELDEVRSGRPLPAATLIKVATLFKDEITVENLPRGQLAALAKYIGLSPFAPEPLLRYQLRIKIKSIKEDDRDLLEEGTGALTLSELQAACEARGMRALGLTSDALRRQLDDWLEVSLKVPITLLLLSRAFTISAPDESVPIASCPGTTLTPGAQAALQESISTLDSNVLREALLGVNQEPTSGAGKREVLELKLEAVKQQNEAIAAEREALESLRESEKAAAAADAAKAAAAAAATDPAKSGEVASMLAAATAAAALANEKRALAVSKQDAATRLREKLREMEPQDVAAAAEALRDIASDAAMVRERELLNAIKRVAKQAGATAMLAQGRIAPEVGTSTSANQAIDSTINKDTEYLRGKLANMLSNVEKELDRLSGDRDLRTALRRVDSDKDGEVSAKEVASALHTIAKSAQSEAAAKALVRLLDTDKDGLVNVEKLSRLMEAYAETTSTRPASSANTIPNTKGHSSNP